LTVIQFSSFLKAVKKPGYLSRLLYFYIKKSRSGLTTIPSEPTLSRLRPATLWLLLGAKEFLPVEEELLLSQQRLWLGNNSLLFGRIRFWPNNNLLLIGQNILLLGNNSL